MIILFSKYWQLVFTRLIFKSRLKEESSVKITALKISSKEGCRVETFKCRIIRLCIVVFRVLKVSTSGWGGGSVVRDVRVRVRRCRIVRSDQCLPPSLVAHAYPLSAGHWPRTPRSYQLRPLHQTADWQTRHRHHCSFPALRCYESKISLGTHQRSCSRNVWI